MIKMLRNKKGMTITEVIVALAVLGIISIPLIAVFSNSIFLTQLTKNQMEINGVMQIAKGDVVQSVKNGADLLDFTDPDDSTKNIKLYAPDANFTAGIETKFLQLQSDNVSYKEKYKYNVKVISIKEEVDGNGTTISYTVQLIIQLYSSDGKLISDLKTDVMRDV